MKQKTGIIVYGLSCLCVLVILVLVVRQKNNYLVLQQRSLKRIHVLQGQIHQKRKELENYKEVKAYYSLKDFALIKMQVEKHQESLDAFAQATGIEYTLVESAAHRLTGHVAVLKYALTAQDKWEKIISFIYTVESNQQPFIIRELELYPAADSLDKVVMNVVIERPYLTKS